VLFHPFLSGIGSPDFEPMVQANISGLTNSRGREDFARAVFEGIAMEIRRIVETIEKYSDINTLRIAGGMSDSSLLVALLAQFCNRDLEISEINDAALVGAAAAAWSGIGRFSSITEAAKTMDRGTHTIRSDTRDSASVDQLYEAYVEGVATIKSQTKYRTRGVDQTP